MEFAREMKFEYSENNHYRWGWDSWFGKYNPEVRYRIKLNSISRPVESFREECVRAVKLIANKTSKPIILGLSGGSDSQMVALSLLQAKIPFEASISRYRKSSFPAVNSHDIAVAYKFCEKFNVKYREVEIDIDDFFRNQAPVIARKYNMPKQGTIIQTRAMDVYGKDYCYIMAGGDVVFTPLKAGKAARLNIPTINNIFSQPCWSESPVPIMQYMIDHDYEGTSKFFMYTPELIAAYLSDPIMQSFLDNCEIFLGSYIDLQPNPLYWWRCFHYLYKPMMTRREFPELIITKKFIGYEQIMGTETSVNAMKIYGDILSKSVRDLYKKESILITVRDLLKYVETGVGEEKLIAHEILS